MKIFNSKCKACPRLVDHLQKIKSKYSGYYCSPVPSFGDSNGQLLIVGLAPGLHGANATGRPFTGDASGLVLYQMLYDFNFSNQPQSVSVDDALRLINCRITNAVKCLPPDNKPNADEINACNPFLKAEIENLPQNAVILALGSIAHKAVLKAYDLKLGSMTFSHNKTYDLPDGRFLIDSYHCSRYNMQTKRLTHDMFADVFRTVVKKLG